MKIYFMNGNGYGRQIGETENKLELYETWGDFDGSKEVKIINDFLKDHDYKSYYWNVCYIPQLKRWHIDVGSWSEWFEIGE